MTSGLFADYGEGLRAGGPVFIWSWLIVGAGQFLVAMVFAQLARQIPLSGYAYQWTSRINGPSLGWFTGFVALLGWISGMTGVSFMELPVISVITEIIVREDGKSRSQWGVRRRQSGGWRGAESGVRPSLRTRIWRPPC